MPQFADLSIDLIDNDARTAPVAADAALIKSGTSTLEAMSGIHGGELQLGTLATRLPVVLWYALHRATKYFGGTELVPELIQDAATP